MNIYFTADLHFGHKNIIRFDGRPYFTVEEMNEDLIERWNNKVCKGDLVYVCGDLFWQGDCHFVQTTLKRLNGQIILIRGNHDRWLHNAGNKRLLAGVKDYDDINVTLKDGTNKRCILSHYFMPFYNGHYYNAIHLHGHSHNTNEAKEEVKIAKCLNKNGYPNEIYNVGCMHWNYEPVTLDEILDKNNEGRRI